MPEQEIILASANATADQHGRGLKLQAADGAGSNKDGGNNPGPVTVADDNSPLPGNLRLLRNLDWQAVPNWTLTLCRINGTWYETSRSEN